MRDTLLRAEAAVASTRTEMIRVVEARIPEGEGRAILLRAVRDHARFTGRGIARERGVNIHSLAWSFLRAEMSIVAVRDRVRMTLVAAACSDTRVSLRLALRVVGDDEDAGYDALARALGRRPTEWRRRVRLPRLLADWQAFVTDHAGALAVLRLPQPKLSAPVQDRYARVARLRAELAQAEADLRRAA